MAEVVRWQKREMPTVWGDNEVEDFLTETRSKVMVFRPTEEEFQNFPTYVRYMEECGANQFGIAKVWIFWHIFYLRTLFSLVSERRWNTLEDPNITTIQIIPPAGWVGCKDFEERIRTTDLTIEHPILQEIKSTHCEYQS